ncbi:MAG: hypothetical protein R6U50_02770 [Desulfobacterales bacterium]
MTTKEETKKKPLWLSIEEKLYDLDAKSLSGEKLESEIQRIARELDDEGYNVSRHGGNLLQLRWAMGDMLEVGRPLMKDLNDATAALTLEDASNPYLAVDNIINEIGKTWPKLKESQRRPEVIRMVEERRLDLLVAKAKELPDDKGVRLLIEEKIAPEIIISKLGITSEAYDQVKARIQNEQAERARVATLLEAVKDKSGEEKVVHLFKNDVSEELIIEMANVDKGTIDGAKKAMEEEMKEKQRLAEEEAARKKKEAEGPALEDIPPDEMLDHIYAIREILEFSDVEKEIRVMCEQSSIPKSLVDIAVSDPEKFDELEKEAGG